MAHYLECIDWSQLNDMNIDDANTFLVTTIINSLYIFVPEKIIRIPCKNILRQPWMTPALLTPSKNKDKLYKKCTGKSKDCKQTIDFIRYRNYYNKLKRIVKQNYYSEELAKFKNDARKTWKILNSIIGRQHDQTL